MTLAKLALAASAGLLALAAANGAAAKDCADLEGLALDKGSVTSAKLVAPGAFEAPPGPFGPPPGVVASPFADLPEFCRVQATLRPTDDSDIKVEVWLPAKGWNGKFVGIGNGIWAGQLSYNELGDPLSRGYAVATTDTGHSGSGLTAEWAVGHKEKLVDFGYRAVHLMTVTAKAAITGYYGEGPAHSFWDSCSTGGRQGLMAAYRYPEDFDAISAMAPANPMTSLMTQTMWANWVPKRDLGGAPDPALLTTVHKMVLAKCDAMDGLADGLVSNPQACNFKPAEMVCKDGQTGNCLSPADAAMMQSLYDGVRAKDGTWLLPGWPAGSETQLTMLVSGPTPFPVAWDYFKLLTYGEDFNWNWMKMDYAQGLADARAFGAGMLDVPADGLSPFFARGGKLLLSHGWNDGLIPATNTLAFYHDLYGAVPQSAAQNQLRLFMVPGMDHCSGGEGPSDFDTLGVIDAWAATDVAPSRIIATRPTAMPAMTGAPKAPPREPMSRPLCPYPMVATFDGEGNPNEAESFSCALPES